MFAIHVVPPAQMRYASVGDWQHVNGTLTITVADTGDRRSTFLVELHELAEGYLCQMNGISEQAVDEFDETWDDASGYDEPGDDPRAPYHREHEAAMALERMAALLLGVDWPAHQARLDRTLARVEKALRRRDAHRSRRSPLAPAHDGEQAAPSRSLTWDDGSWPPVGGLRRPARDAGRLRFARPVTVLCARSRR